MKVVLSPNPYRDRGLRAAQAAEKILRNVGVELLDHLIFADDDMVSLKDSGFFEGLYREER